MRVAIVLGAGGPKAWPWHAGVLQALSDADLEPASAELLIGTSAGSAVATATRFGARPDELVAAITAPRTDEDRALVRRLTPSGRRDRLAAAVPRSPGLLLDLIRRDVGTGVAAAGILPGGIFPTVMLGRIPSVPSDAPMPSGLWVPTVRIDDGATVVLGRDHTPGITANDAVEASSAVPWIFQAKDLGGRRHVDGAAASPTHADLALDIEPDLVVVSSVMSRPGRRPGQLLARRRLTTEVETLRRAGAMVAIAEVDAATATLMDGFPYRGQGRAPAIMAAAQRRVTHELIALGLTR